MNEEEIRLFLERASRAPLLDREQELRVAKAARRGDETARKTLVEVNLRLLVSIARQYLDRGMPLGTLLQAGNLGLTRAVEQFDHSKGYRLSTFATWWIRQAITRHIAEGSE